MGRAFARVWVCAKVEVTELAASTVSGDGTLAVAVAV